MIVKLSCSKILLIISVFRENPLFIFHALLKDYEAKNLPVETRLEEILKGNLLHLFKKYALST